MQDKTNEMKQDMINSLPPKVKMIDRTIDFALDRIRAGKDVEHYKEVLRKLSKEKQR